MITKKIIVSIVSIILVLFVLVGGFYIYNQRNQSILQTEKNQAISAFNNNNLDDSITKAQELSKNNKTKVDGLLLLATSYVQKGSLEFKEKQYGDLAIQTANQVISIDPNNAEAYRLIGYANEIEQNYPEALKNYDKSISLNSSNAVALASRGHAYYLMGDNDKATNDFNAALKIDSHMDSAWLNLARISYENGADDKASEFLSKISIQNLPVVLQADYYTISALIKQSAFDVDGASSDFSKALGLNPNSPFVITNNALIKLVILVRDNKVINTNDVKKLISDVEKSITIDPNLTISYITLGKMNTIIGDIKDAKIQFQKAKEVLPNDITLSATQKTYTLSDIDGLLDTQITKTK